MACSTRLPSWRHRCCSAARYFKPPGAEDFGT
jgi:hypothetical protein